MFTLIDELAHTHTLSTDNLLLLLEKRTPELSEYLFAKARSIKSILEGLLNSPTTVKTIVTIAVFVKAAPLACVIDFLKKIF